LAKGHTIILRSTVAPKTTHYIKNYLEKKTEFRIGDDIFLAFCPERIVEGKAYQELTELPQIIGAEDDESFLNAKSIFSCLTQHIMRTSYTSAELAKLFNNIYRYVECAISNQFALIADSYDQDVYSILHMSNFKYPRATILSPGLTAGTCLRKDFGMINEAIPYSDLLLSSWKVNEYIPKFLIDHLLKRTEVKDKNIAVLGYTFKKDSDDIRDSLVPKLLRYIEREVPNIIKIHEPHLENIDEKYENYTLDKAIDNADIVYISVNHSEFKLQKEFILDKVKTTCWFVDIWNVLDTNKIFFKKGEVLK
jgi:UDP-N-acetyl-D-mannosaminuronic acid dehydrogenase